MLDGRCALARSLQVDMSTCCLPAIGGGGVCIWESGITKSRPPALGTSPEHHCALSPGWNHRATLLGSSFELTVILCLCHLLTVILSVCYFSVSAEVWGFVPAFEMGKHWPCFSPVYILLLGLSAAGEGRDAAGIALSEENRQGCAQKASLVLGFSQCARKQHMKLHVPALRFLNTEWMGASGFSFSEKDEFYSLL